LRFQAYCDAGNDCSSGASEYAKINSDTCNEAVGTLGDISDDGDKEVPIQLGDGSDALNQAYTCVKVQLETPDYLGKLLDGESKIVPLKGTQAVNKVLVEWFSTNDISSSDDNKLSLLHETSGQPLLTQGSWPTNRPPIFRVQLMQFGADGFKLSDFDNVSGSNSNANTVFLYPNGTSNVANSTITTADLYARDARKTPTGSPFGVTCSGDISAGGYACRVMIELPNTINAGSREAYLRISSIYNTASYRTTLLNGSDSVLFDGVQPIIDSTGRANDLFRRVVTRVELADVNYPYPMAAVDITGNFCKDFRLTDKADDYLNNCAP
jgi:hypothetical protein